MVQQASGFDLEQTQQHPLLSGTALPVLSPCTADAAMWFEIVLASCCVTVYSRGRHFAGGVGLPVTGPTHVT